MNGFESSFWRGFIVLAIVSCTVGCEKKPTPAPSTNTATAPALGSTPEFRDGPDAQTILRDVVSRYATAKSYTDQAKLYLSYQLEGRNIQEPQWWSTSWTREGSLAAKLFSGRLQGNGSLLSCYVYDIDSANLDNQHLLMPYDEKLPLDQLFRDSIAKHFLGGYSELPLDETDPLSQPQLIPAPLSLLTNQVRNGWIQMPEKVVRLPDDTLDGQSCYVVRSLFNDMTSDIWIDSEDHLIKKMSLPLKLLAGEVVTSPEITDVVLIAEFHEANINCEIPPESFEIPPHQDATPVRRFVALPEPFPSELIGQSAPDFSLVDRRQEPIENKDFDGKVTTLLWIAGRPSFSSIAKLDLMAQSLSTDEFHFGIVYSDSELKSPGSGSIETVDTLARAIQNSTSSTYYDPQMNASSALQIKTIPSVLVMDGNSKIQFARSLINPNWPNEVKAVIDRVAQGDDVGTEMLEEYQRFLSSYQQQLTTVSAPELLPINPQESPEINRRRISQAKGGARMRPVKIWSNSEFQQAGNIAALSPNSDSSDQLAFLVIDGWRTIVQLDRHGKSTNRIELQLPEGIAANMIRTGTDQNGDHLFAVFSKLGSQVFLFDSRWNPKGSFPEKPSAQSKIRDCQLTDVNSDGISELAVAFENESGVVLVSPKTLASKRISESGATSIASQTGDLVVTRQGKLGTLQTSLTNQEETELDFQRVAALDSDRLCGLGVTRQGQWNAVGFDKDLVRTWTLSIGSQFFETEIEPLSVASTDADESIWAIADTSDAIHLVSGTGKWLGDFQSETRLGGVNVSSIDDQILLLVANESGLECWNLNLNRNPMRPVSAQK